MTKNVLTLAQIDSVKYQLLRVTIWFLSTCLINLPHPYYYNFQSDILNQIHLKFLVFVFLNYFQYFEYYHQKYLQMSDVLLL